MNYERSIKNTYLYIIEGLKKLIIGNPDLILYLKCLSPLFNVIVKKKIRKGNLKEDIIFRNLKIIFKNLRNNILKDKKDCKKILTLLIKIQKKLSRKKKDIKLILKCIDKYDNLYKDILKIISLFDKIEVYCLDIVKKNSKNILNYLPLDSLEICKISRDKDLRHNLL